MPYRVDLARNAEAELEELHLWVVERAPQQGAAWFNGLERAVLSLDQHPERCPVAPESVALQFPDKMVERIPIAVDRSSGDVFEGQRLCHRSISDFSVASSDAPTGNDAVVQIEQAELRPIAGRRQHGI